MPASFFAVLLAASALPAVAYSQPRAIEPGEDFPLEDHSVWVFAIQRGLKDQAAELQLAKAPESPETVALLLDAYRPGDALMVLRRIVDRRPERMGAAFKAASTTGHRFDDDGRVYPSVLRDIVARARQRLREYRANRRRKPPGICTSLPCLFRVKNGVLARSAARLSGGICGD